MSKILNLRYAGLILLAMIACAGDARAQNAFDDPGSRGAPTGGGGDLVPVADKVEAGAVALGSETQVVVLFRNEDSKPIKTGAINLYPSSNITAAVGENQCSADIIEPGEICAMSIQVKGLQPGQYRIELLMRHDGRAKLLTTTLNGTVEKGTEDTMAASSDLEVIPAEMDFGTLTESRSQVNTVILRNKTAKPITIKDFGIQTGSQSGYTVEGNCSEMKVGEACVVSVKWMPQQKGLSTGTLVINHNGPTAVSTVSLKGTYTPSAAAVAQTFPDAVPGKGLLVSSLESVDFGTDITQSSSMTVSLVNVGDVALTLTGISMTNAENGVRAERSGCVAGLSLAPLEACPLTLTWEPVREGSILDDVQVSHTGARGVLVLPLRGSASRGINKDKKAIMLGSSPGLDAIISNIQPLSMGDMGDDDVVMEGNQKTTMKKSANAARKAKDSGADAEREVDVRGALDGYAITSYSTKRAIVNGPGGSRVVFDGEQTVISGILWEIKMRPSAVEFRNGSQKVLLLFDRSLSSFGTIDASSTLGRAAPVQEESNNETDLPASASSSTPGGSTPATPPAAPAR